MVVDAVGGGWVQLCSFFLRHGKEEKVKGWVQFESLTEYRESAGIGGETHFGEFLWVYMSTEWQG